jgi:hypothetical protein
MALLRPQLAVPRTNDAREIRKWREGLSKWAVADFEGYVFYIKSSELDQGVSTDATFETIKTLKDVIELIETSTYCIVVFIHNGDTETTEYNFDTSLDLTNYQNVYLEIRPGAQLTRTTGDEVLTLYEPSQLQVYESQKITSVDMIAFSIPGIVHVAWWGAVGDGSTDDSTAIQIPIDRMVEVKGGIVQFLSKEYACANIEMGSYVTLRGIGTVSATSTAGVVLYNNKTILKGNDGGAIVKTPTTTVKDICIEFINFVGMGASVALKGLYLDDCDTSTFRFLSFDNFGLQALQLDEGNANLFSRILAQNSLLYGGLEQKTGVFDFYGTSDNFFEVVEVSGSLTELKSTNLYHCAWAFHEHLEGTVYSANNFLVNCVGEFADIGIYLESDQCAFEGCRCDINWGHGFYIASQSTQNRFTACFALRNGLETNNTYDGFYIEGANNVFSACLSTGFTGDSNKPRWGFNDTLSSNSQANLYSSCLGANNSSGTFNGDNSWLGSSFKINKAHAFSANDATPSVDGGDVFMFSGYTQATDITDFDDGTPFQVIRVMDRGTNNYVTIKNNANIKTISGSDISGLSQYVIYSFLHVDGIWREF